MGDSVVSPEGEWLLKQIDAFEALGPTEQQKAAFLLIVNRCAQLGRWAARWTPEHERVPSDTDPYWERDHAREE